MKLFRSVIVAALLACVVVAAHATVARATASLTAQNTCSTWVALNSGFNLSLSGTWVATVHLQRSFSTAYTGTAESGDTTQLDVASYTANIQDRGIEPETGVKYRVCVKTGNYTSGTVVARISQ